jgi:hypothetical protein
MASRRSLDMPGSFISYSPVLLFFRALSSHAPEDCIVSLHYKAFPYFDYIPSSPKRSGCCNFLWSEYWEVLTKSFDVAAQKGVQYDLAYALSQQRSNTRFGRNGIAVPLMT